MSNPRIPYRMAHSGLSLPPLQGKTLIVHLVVNVEHWQFEQPMPRTLLTPPHGREQVPDIPNFAWAEYGMRCGMPRILDLLARCGVTASTSFNAGVIDAYPQCAEAILRAGWEFVGHGIHQRAVHGESDEKAHIEEALEKIRFFTGSRPRGWLSPGLRETVETPDLLRAAGIDYIFDWVLDDLPCWMATKHGPLIAMPYTLEINDSVIYAVERHASGEMERRFERTLALFEREMKTGPRILTLGLHPHLIGVPHRLGELERMLDRLLRRDDVIFVSGAAMADWFVAAHPAGEAR
jgi:peptidoglycan/xylan/chitin deacetylase (PgdA/CDA1 family)